MNIICLGLVDARADTPYNARTYDAAASASGVKRRKLTGSNPRFIRRPPPELTGSAHAYSRRQLGSRCKAGRPSLPGLRYELSLARWLHCAQVAQATCPSHRVLSWPRGARALSRGLGRAPPKPPLWLACRRLPLTARHSLFLARPSRRRTKHASRRARRCRWSRSRCRRTADSRSRLHSPAPHPSHCAPGNPWAFSTPSPALGWSGAAAEC